MSALDVLLLGRHITVKNRQPTCSVLSGFSASEVDTSVTNGVEEAAGEGGSSLLRSGQDFYHNARLKTQKQVNMLQMAPKQRDIPPASQKLVFHFEFFYAASGHRIQV